MRADFSQFYDPLKQSEMPGSEQPRSNEENEAIYRLLILRRQFVELPSVGQTSLIN